MKRILIVMVIASLAAGCLLAQAWRGNLRVQGTVVDVQTGEPVKNAVIKLRVQQGGSGGPDAKTDAKGKWAVLGLSSGGWDIDVEAPGYVTTKATVVLRATERIPPMKIEMERVHVEEAAPQEEPVLEEAVKIGGVTVTADIAAAVEAGNNFLKESKFKEAVEQYEKAYPTLSSNLSLKLALARAYAGAGDQKKALVLVDEAYKADPANVQIALLLSELLLQDGQLDRGKSVIESLPAGTVTDPTYMVNIGILMMNKNQPAAAREYFSKAIALDAARGESYYFRGLAAIQAGKAKEAKADLQKAIELAPDSPEAKEAKELLKQIK